ncbi:sensor histidine kinase [Dehalobacterium formicoaceticum]|uniref:sensor histidine kinase n=1 Tax=Dehalobacterium formicoaceticum TaxID=51515 RepID=UPI0012F8FAB2|nr:ATP-binding protein [Dehalobacterium formicoaceticum]
MSVNLTIIITIFLQAILFVIVNHYIFILDDFISLKALLPFINILMIILFIFLFKSIKKLETLSKKRLEANLLKEHLKQIETMLKMMQEEQHDHNKHIQTLQAMVHLNEIDNAKEYIDGIAEKHRYTDVVKFTGNPALTALLNSKYKVAELKQIKFDFSIKCNINEIILPPWDLCSIIGNILDNAFEAVLEKENNRNVGLEIKFENNNYVIYVINNGPKIPKSIQKSIFQPGNTTKGSEGRGYGLFIVKKLVDEYNGEIQVLSEEKTVFIVSLPKERIRHGQKDIINNSEEHRTAPIS